jgi:thiamine pyrophosphate-dependent acetolactate synthase large subunit-like protein
MLTPTIGQGTYGSDLVVDRMQRDDIPYVALNPGSTFRGLHDSLVNYGGNTPEIVLAQHEKVAMQEPQGPVYLCYDAAFQEDPLDGEQPLPDPGKVSPGTRMQADPAALDQLAEWLLTAQQPVILAGYLERHKPSFHRLA